MYIQYYLYKVVILLPSNRIDFYQAIRRIPIIQPIYKINIKATLETCSHETSIAMVCFQKTSNVLFRLPFHPSICRSVEVNASGSVLADEDKVPDSQVTVVLVRLPWVGATPEKVKDLGGGEFEIVDEEEKKGSSKTNALCEVGFSSGMEYFEIEVIEGSGPFIGVTTKPGFHEGWKIKGLFFGGPGNLSNGSAGLRTQFGEEVKTGSVIGVALDLSNDKAVGLTFWEGDTCLGEAFKDCPREPGALVFPVVCANKSGDRFKLSLKRNPRKPKTITPHPAVGCWDLQRMVAGELVNLDAALAVKGKGKGRGYVEGAEESKGNIVMTVTSRDSKVFKISVKLGNTLMTTVSRLRSDFIVDSRLNFSFLWLVAFLWFHP